MSLYCCIGIVKVIVVGSSSYESFFSSEFLLIFMIEISILHASSCTNDPEFWGRYPARNFPVRSLLILIHWYSFSALLPLSQGFIPYMGFVCYVVDNNSNNYIHSLYSHRLCLQIVRKLSIRCSILYFQFLLHWNTSQKTFLDKRFYHYPTFVFCLISVHFVESGKLNDLTLQSYLLLSFWSASLSLTSKYSIIQKKYYYLLLPF